MKINGFTNSFVTHKSPIVNKYLHFGLREVLFRIWCNVVRNLSLRITASCDLEIYQESGATMITKAKIENVVEE